VRSPSVTELAGGNLRSSQFLDRMDFHSLALSLSSEDRSTRSARPLMAFAARFPSTDYVDGGQQPLRQRGTTMS